MYMKILYLIVFFYFGIMVVQSPDPTKHKNLHLLNHDICGPIDMEKILGGSVIQVSHFRWMALLKYNYRNGSHFLCAGSIINKRFILTAAHCVTNSPNIILTGVRVGENNLLTDPDCDEIIEGFESICIEKHQEFGIVRKFIHPDYVNEVGGSDIAMLKLDGDIKFSSSAAIPICLPIDVKTNLTGLRATVSGWGLTENGFNSPVLMKVHLPVQNIEMCNTLYQRIFRRWKINVTEKQMCAGGEEGRDSCDGDSGAPLQRPAVYDNDVKFVQFGIVSYGTSECGQEGYPAVYTSVVYFLDWILDTLDK